MVDSPQKPRLPSRASSTPKHNQQRIPAPVGRTALLASLALMLGILLVHLLDSSSAETDTAFLRAETAVLTSERQGTIREILLAEGETADIDQPMVLLTDDSLESAIAAQQTRLAEMRSALARSLAQLDVDLAWRIKELDSEILRIRLKSADYLGARHDEKMQSHAWRDVLAGKIFNNDENASESVVIPIEHIDSFAKEPRLRAIFSYEAAVNGAEVAAVQHQLCEDRINDLKALKADMSEQLGRAGGVDSAKARVQQAADKLKRLQSKNRTFRLPSPAFGTVGIYRKQPGEQVGAGETIVELLDEDARFLLLSIPTRTLPLYQTGTDVALLFPGGEKRTGKVSRIPPQTDAASQSTSEDARIVLRIDPTEKLWPNVPIGSAVTVTR